MSKLQIAELENAKLNANEDAMKELKTLNDEFASYKQDAINHYYNLYVSSVEMQKRFDYDKEIDKIGRLVILQNLHEAENEVKKLREEIENPKKKIPQQQKDEVETIQIDDSEDDD